MFNPQSWTHYRSSNCNLQFVMTESKRFLHRLCCCVPQVARPTDLDPGSAWAFPALCALWDREGTQQFCMMVSLYFAGGEAGDAPRQPRHKVLL